MTEHEVLEAMMLIAFSISWYWSIARMVRMRTALGKSASFVVLICCGYIMGVMSKVLAYNDTGYLSPLVWLYAWNLMVTAFDLALVLYYARNNRQMTA